MREAQDKIHLEEEKQIRELAEQVIRREEQIQKREEEEEVRRVTRLQEMTEFNAKEQKRV